MKKITLALVLIGLTGLSPSLAFARRRHKAPPKPQVEPIPDADSCGLGWQVTQKRTLSAMTTRSTTNVGTVLPSFGMTSGTIGCKQMPLSDEDQKAVRYTYNNFDSLSVEMAEGRGEYLSVFGRALGCTDPVMPEFERAMQAHYREIMPDATESATPQDQTAESLELFGNVKAELRKDPTLASGCGAA